MLTSVSYDVGLYSEIEVLQAIGTANVNLTGSIDNNLIIGNAGSNVIDGSYGKDTVTGGGGADLFLWASVDEIGLFNFDPDIVTDFSTAQGDVLHFTNIDADETVAGNQDFTFIGTAAFTAPGQINWVTNGTDTFIQLNTNADLTVDGIIQLNGVPSGDAVFDISVRWRRMAASLRCTVTPARLSELLGRLSDAVDGRRADRWRLRRKCRLTAPGGGGSGLRLDRRVLSGAREHTLGLNSVDHDWSICSASMAPRGPRCCGG